MDYMKKRFLILISLLLFLLIASLTNPTKDDYVSFVKEELVKEEQQLIAVFAGPFIDAYTTKQNFGIFSIYNTQFSKKEKQPIKAIGLFNQFIVIKS